MQKKYKVGDRVLVNHGCRGECKGVIDQIDDSCDTYFYMLDNEKFLRAGDKRSYADSLEDTVGHMYKNYIIKKEC